MGPKRSGSREQRKLIWGAMIEKIWGAGRRSINFEGSGELGTPLAEPQSIICYIISTGCLEKVPSWIAPRSETEGGIFYRQCQAGMVHINPDKIINDITEIWIVGNPIRTILDKTFSRFQYCRVLSLAYNEIELLQILAFKQLISLEELYLNNNELTYLEEGVFDHFSQTSSPLVRLYLQENKITSFTGSLLSKLTKLEFLDVTGNPLTRIDDQVWAVLIFVTHWGFPDGKTIRAGSVILALTYLTNLPQPYDLELFFTKFGR